MKVIWISIAALAVVLAGLGVGLYVWVQSQMKSVSSDTATQRFVIAKGQALAVTARNLEESGLVRNAYVFRYYAQFTNVDTNIQAGSYDLSPAMTTPEIAQALTQGTEDIWITVLEGWRREEIAQYLAAQMDLEQFDETEFLALTEDLEGRLFPDTYLIPRESTAEFIVSLLTNTFETKVLKGLAVQLQQSSLSLDQVVILASIVEREGRGYQDMRHVAGILQNRLTIGMPLQADATLQYIEGESSDGKWWVPPRVTTKESTSPFNTYKFPGLPPSPIANPGIQALEAVLDPVPSDDLFYIHTPSGEAYYSETLEEHNANINKYLR